MYWITLNSYINKNAARLVKLMGGELGVEEEVGDELEQEEEIDEIIEKKKDGFLFLHFLGKAAFVEEGTSAPSTNATRNRSAAFLTLNPPTVL